MCYSERDISLDDFEKKMLGDGWQKKVIKRDSSWRYFYYNYVKKGKMIYSPLFHSSAPNVFWVKPTSDFALERKEAEKK